MSKVIGFMVLNNLMFFCAVVLLIKMSKSFLFFMLGLEVLYISILSGFVTIASIPSYEVGSIFALFLIGIAAAEAVIGFYIAVLLFIQKQSLVFSSFFRLKG